MIMERQGRSLQRSVAAINKITAELQKCGLSANAPEVKKKIESIRNQYRRELRKQEKSKKSGAGAYSMYTHTLWCFDDLCFLSNGDNMRECVSSMESQASHMPEEVSDHEIFTDPVLIEIQDSYRASSTCIDLWLSYGQFPYT
ncbi:uncharacterized protein LOC135110748 [Scylla paramamosain]|uniref:uncharacterized protein LOC135110748 n=1 Tax=Scylla paramamosain TaxID=85552 RepID=UPI0030829982